MGFRTKETQYFCTSVLLTNTENLSLGHHVGGYFTVKLSLFSKKSQDSWVVHEDDAAHALCDRS